MLPVAKILTNRTAARNTDKNVHPELRRHYISECRQTDFVHALAGIMSVIWRDKENN